MSIRKQLTKRKTRWYSFLVRYFTVAPQKSQANGRTFASFGRRGSLLRLRPATVNAEDEACEGACDVPCVEARDSVIGNELPIPESRKDVDFSGNVSILRALSSFVNCSVRALANLIYLLKFKSPNTSASVSGISRNFALTMCEWKREAPYWRRSSDVCSGLCSRKDTQASRDGCSSFSSST
jgi:hypothetical protein